MSEYKECWLCGRNGSEDPLDEHHIFEGWGNRRVSVEYDITVPLCHDRCHIFGRDAAHNSKATADKLHRYGQRKLMIREGWTVEEFRLHFGKNWLDEEEIEEIERVRSSEFGVRSWEEDFEVIEEDEDDLPEWLRCA